MSEKLSLWSRMRTSIAEDFRHSVGAGPFSGNDTTGTPVAQFTPGAVEFVRLFGESAALSSLYRRQWAVRTCVNYLALNIAHLNLKVYRKVSESEREPAADSPLAALLQRPNPRTSRFDMIRGTVSDLAIYDNSYWMKRFIGNARELYRIPPEFVGVWGGDILTGPSKYVIDVGNGRAPLRLRPDEVVHFRGYNANDTRVGSSPLEALRSILAEEVAASKHREGFWKNAARREGVIERPLEAPVLDDEGLKRLTEGWAGRTAGAENAGRTAVLEEGGHWNPDSFSPKDSEFIAGRQFALDTVATEYGIPLALLSRSSTPTFASLKEFHKALYVDVLGPWNAMIEGALWLQLLPDFGDPDLYVEFNIEEKLQGDFESTADAMRSHVQVPDMSVNEARKIRNLPPLDDPAFDEPARPANYTYQGQEPAPAALVGLPAAAMNGHSDEIAVLEAILEER